MSLLLPDTERRIVPRWRTTALTLARGELDGIRSRIHSQADPPREFRRKLYIWETERSLEAAVELVAAAFVYEQASQVLEAVKLLLDPKTPVSPTVRTIASLVLDRVMPARAVEDQTLEETELELPIVYERIRTLKSRLIEVPRNSFMWVDISRFYSTLGQKDKSILAMENAPALGRSNRFVLRSAARLFVHLREPDRAHDLLWRADATRTDPWLLSAEIAVASIRGRSSTLTKQARHILGSSSLAPRHTAELASAMGTVELLDGGHRRARRLFRQSLTDPTENAVAQAEWASSKDPAVDVAPDPSQRARSYEAQATANFHSGDWVGTIAHCDGWLLDEPFSGRPATLGSYVACVALQEYPLGEEMARRGLRANADDIILLNNLTVALASQGRVDEAIETFKRIPRGNEDKTVRSVLLATEGLIHFRSGNPVEGRRLYKEAIDLGSQAPSKKTGGLAAVHLAREELLAGASEASEALRRALDACSGFDAPEVSVMLKTLQSLAANLSPNTHA
jgi:tetratricopeptide (TPR) repeat protein